MRITYEQPTAKQVLTRTGTLTGEVSEAGMLRVQWDEDGYGRNGWVAPGTFQTAD